jgi:hypothetical protein
MTSSAGLIGQLKELPKVNILFAIQELVGFSEVAS